MEELVSPAVPDSVSLDLPPSIETLITMPAPPVTQGALGEIPTGTTQLILMFQLWILECSLW